MLQLLLMIKLIPILLSVLFFLVPILGFAQTAQPNASGIGWSNQTISSATAILAYDGSRLGWTIHPENGNLRCTFGNAYGSTPPNPTSSTGFELVSGGYYSSYPTTPATAEAICIPETGSVTLSTLLDYR